MFKKHRNQRNDRIDSLVGMGSTIAGDMSFSGGLRIDGVVMGNVTGIDDKGGTLVISENARIEGKVSCTHLILNGEIVGPIDVAQYVELQAKARIKGDLRYRTLEVHPGAIVEGRLMHISEIGAVAETSVKN